MYRYVPYPRVGATERVRAWLMSIRGPGSGTGAPTVGSAKTWIVRVVLRTENPSESVRLTRIVNEPSTDGAQAKEASVPT